MTKYKVWGKYQFLGIFFGSLLLLPLMVTRQSLWLDEGDTAIYAIQPNFHAWKHRLMEDLNADCQMPLTMFTAWLAGKVVGTSELGMRSQNLLWGIIALFAFYKVGLKVQNPWVPLLLVIQPFFWFYMDEARPYMPQIALSSILFYLLISFQLSENLLEKSWLVAFLATLLVIYSASMLCAVTILAVSLVLLLQAPRKVGTILLKNWMTALGFIFLMGLLSNYYMDTLHRGAQGTRIWGVDFKSIGFIFYEFIGCLGLGPSLETIRQEAAGGRLISLVSGLWLPLLAAALLFYGLLYYFLKKREYSNSPSRLCLISLTVLVFVSSSMVIASYILHKPLWARHFSSVLPFLVFIEATILQSAFASKNILPKWGMSVFLILMTASSLQIRFSDRFAKDDYREAAKIASTALQAGSKVWWSAAEYTGQYYGVTLNAGDESKGAVVMHNTPIASALAQGVPDVIITSRQEVYDPSGAIQDYIEKNNYEFLPSPKNFRIYAKRSF